MAFVGVTIKLNFRNMNGFKQLQSCIQACLRCASTCDYCASSCLKERDVAMMAKCIQLDMECAAICYTSAKLMSLGSAKAKEICRICADICQACSDECGKHQHEHCQECAKTCKECSDECKRFAA